jgi:hypothetical protein
VPDSPASRATRAPKNRVSWRRYAVIWANSPAWGVYIVSPAETGREGEGVCIEDRLPARGARCRPRSWLAVPSPLPQTTTSASLQGHKADRGAPARPRFRKPLVDEIGTGSKPGKRFLTISAPARRGAKAGKVRRPWYGPPPITSTSRRDPYGHRLPRHKPASVRRGYRNLR